MGRVFSHLKRSMMNINIEQRAYKEISREKPKPAPKYPTPAAQAHAKQFPKIDTEKLQPSKPLLDRLRQVYVTSVDTSPVESKAQERPLPQKRKADDDYEYGYWEPEAVPEGKFTLRQGIEFIHKHGEEPEAWSAHVIAKDYKLDLGTTQKILHFFKPHELRLPTKKETQSLASKFLKRPSYTPLPPQEK